MVVLVHKRLLVMIVCLAFYQYTTFAQSITELQNKPHIGDKIERQVIEGIYCGKKGDHILWDFSNCTFKEENSPIRVSSDSLGFHCSEAGLQSYYLLSGDSLLKHAFRSKLEEITYKKPQIAMLYPFTYSDSISSSFYGEGTFCDTYQLSHHGTRTIIADAKGSIILPDNKIIKEVLRVHTVTSNNILLEGMDANLVDTATTKQELAEDYLWYAKECRYPIFEYHISTSYGNGKKIGTQSAAYCYLPNNLMDNVVSLKETRIPMDYKVSQMGCSILISYSTKSEATINFIITNTMGVVCQNKTYSGKAGENHNASFNCYGYPSGEYILYVNVNGIVNSEKFHLK